MEIVIIPAHNEEKHISKVIRNTQEYTKNIIVVDDGSTDNTFQEAKNSEVTLIHHKVNLGKGAALKTGCDYAILNGATSLIVMDADGQHDPKEIINFKTNLKENDIVFSYRIGKESMPKILKFGNWFISKVAKTLYGPALHDTQCGFRAFSAETYKKIRWESCDYSLESEMIANVGKNKLKYSQIPIATIYNDKYKGTTALDGIKIVLKMIGWKITK